MDNKRRAKELDLTPTRPWPTIQRRKIEKLRDQRQEEFERACSDNFDWLENYYQGCVYAARQNKRLIERIQPSNRSTNSNASQSQTPNKRETKNSQQLDSPALSELSFDGSIQPMEAQQHENQVAHQGSRTPTASTGSDALTGQYSQNPTSDSVRRNRSKTGSVQFQLRSPRTPKLYSPLSSPRSPYERQRRTPRRSRLRVDASAATRKALRALKSFRKRTSSYSIENHNGTRTPDTPVQLSTQDVDIQQHKSRVLEQMQGSGKKSLSSNHSSQLSHRNSDSNEGFYSSKETLVNTSTMDLSFSGSESSFSRKTPSKGAIGVRPIQLRLEEDEDMEDMDGVEDFHTTPGSRARDSMTLISPAAWSGSSKGRDSSFLGSTPLLDKLRGQKPSGIFSNRHSGQDMDMNQDILIHDSDYNRPRSSPFQDSIAPVRFGSPGAESSQKDVPVSKSKETERNPTPQSAIHTTSNDLLRREGIFRNPTSVMAPSLEENTAKHSNNQKPTQATGVLTSTNSLPLHTNDIYRGQIESDAMRTSSLLSLNRSRVNAPQEKPCNPKDSLGSTNGPDVVNSNEVSDITSKLSSHREDPRRPPDLISSERKASEQAEKASVNPTSNNGGIGEREAGSEVISRNVTSEAKDSNLGVPGTASSLMIDNPLPRSRVATTLPEKRIVGQRKPTAPVSTSQSHAVGSQMPPSRLLKINSSLTQTNQASSSQGTAAPNQPQPSTMHVTNRIHKTGVTSLFKDAQQQTQTTGAKATSSALSSSNLLRQGVPRAPLPSTKGTENSLARAESQSVLTRKLFSTSKSAFSLKKPIRPVLPDSTLTAKSIALSGITASTTSKSGPTSPKKDSKKELTPVDSRLREQTPDVTPKVNGVSVQHSASGSAPIANTPAQSLKNSLVAIATSGRNKQNKETSSSATLQPEINSNTNPFLVPAPVHCSSAPAWAQNQSRPRSSHEETILPEIESEGEDTVDQESGTSSSRRAPIPEWAEWDELEKAMRRQSHMNPEDIFGPLPALDMSEIFPGKEKRLRRRRTSSAHWGVADRLTPQEVTRYNEDMGWSTKD
ncbi:hypothetical protein BGX21_011499 [Mortierella sp. AD011]|nr:hypothetical protein BGX20_009763 [Mortierella sp. AD010]KAF9390261.1 hypothetical protein BGX21_011499 [Mortierella sp. AD011]